MQTYLDQLQYVLDHGVTTDDRTGVGTLKSFGLQARYDLSKGFPAVTTKKLAFKVMASELLWFISGSSNLQDLKGIYPQNKIWDANYEDYLVRKSLSLGDGDMGRVYGTQWRRWLTADGQEVDQLAEAIALIRTIRTPDASSSTLGIPVKLATHRWRCRPATIFSVFCSRGTLVIANVSAVSRYVSWRSF